MIKGLKEKKEILLAGVFIFFSLFSFFILSEQADAATLVRPPSNLGLVGYWPMDEGVGTKAMDLSGRGNAGTISGATWTSGKRGGALSFNGSSAYVDAGTSNQFDLSASAFTVAAWVKLDNFHWSFNYSNRIVIKRADDNNAWQLTTSDVAAGAPHNQFNLVIRKGGVNTIVSSDSVVAGVWYYVVGVSDGSNLKIYLNGVLQGANTGPTNFGVGTLTNLYIGAKTDPNSYTKGIIDDVRIYNRALTATEVAKLYSAGQVTRKQVSNQGLVGYWSFNEGNGTKAGDSSGNNNTGTITGATWTGGKRGGALSFNGAFGQGVDNGNKASLNLSGSGTISAWVKYNAQGAWQVVVNKYDASLDRNGYAFAISDLNQLCIFLANATNNDSLCTSSSYADGKWHNFVGTWDSSFIKIYVDGQMSGSPVAQNYIPVSSAYNLYFGNFQGNNYRYTGSLDDVRIYNRALSATEVQALYKQTEVKINSSQNNKLTDGLVGLWSFDGKDVNWATGIAYDRSGQGNNGNISGMSTTTSPAMGKIGQALKFDGAGVADDIVNALSPTSLDNIEQQGGGGFTISSWVYGKGYGESSLGFIASKANNVSNGWILRYSVTGNRLEFNVDYDGANNLNVQTGSLSSTWNQWTHWVVTWDGSVSASNVHMYKNGVEVSYSSQTDGQGNRLTDAAQSLTIGNNSGVGRTFDGSLDDVRLYNRVLSASEVKQLYNMGR